MTIDFFYKLLNNNQLMIEIVRLFIMLMLIVVGIAMIRVKRILSVILLSSIFSFLMAIFFVLLDAVDVAFTEAAVGAGLSTVLVMSAMALVFREAKPASSKNSLVAFVTVLLTGVALIFASIDMPPYGLLNTPANSGIGMQYIDYSNQYIDIPNIVTAILASFRGYDTMGEVFVVFTAGLAVLTLLGRDGKRGGKKVKSLELSSLDKSLELSSLEIDYSMNYPQASITDNKQVSEVKLSSKKPPSRKPPSRKLTSKKTASNKPASKKLTSRKIVASKKTISRMPAASKTASKKTASNKPASKKLTSRKIVASKKTISRMPAASKTASKKTASNKPASKKLTSRKIVASKKTISRMPAASKTASKKTVSNKPTSKKPASKKLTSRKPTKRY